MTGASQVRERVRPLAAALLHPCALLALTVLIVNDHYLKRAHPSFLTGKLSDLAGLVLAPLVLGALHERWVVWRTRRTPEPRVTRQVLALSILASSLGFALVEVWRPAELVYTHGLAALQWPVRMLAAWFSGQRWPAFVPVAATADVSDLLALPMGFVAWWLGSPGASPRRASAQRRVVWSTLGGAGLLLWSPPSRAQAPNTSEDPERHARGRYTHDGFYAAAQAGVGALLVSSDASVSNGFRQAIPSSSRGPLFPAVSVAAGGTVNGLVLGLRALLSDSPEPNIDTLGSHFAVSDLRIHFTDVALFASYYPDVHAGWHLGGALGLCRLSVGDGVKALDDAAYPGSEQQSGVSASLDGGYSVWVHRELSLGGGLRLTAARTTGTHGSTLLFAPQLLASVTWH